MTRQTESTTGKWRYLFNAMLFFTTCLLGTPTRKLSGCAAKIGNSNSLYLTALAGLSVMQGAEAVLTGRLKWKYLTGSYVFSSPTIGADGTIYVGSYDFNLYAINPSGSLKWKYLTGNYISSSPTIGGDGTIYVGSYDYNLYAINSNGTLQWRYLTVVYILSSPTIGGDGTIYVGCHGNVLYAINSNGTLRWQYLTGDGYVDSSPTIGADGTIYVGSYDRNLYAINSNGTLRWKYLTDSYVYSSPTIGADGTIYVGSYGFNLYAISSNGTLQWRYLTDGVIYSSPAIGADGTIYVGSFDDNLYAINPSGSLKWKYFMVFPVYSSPRIGGDGTIYVGSFDGNLYAINPNGSLKWKYLTGNDIHSSPTIGADGTVYVGCDDFNLYAITRYTQTTTQSNTLTSIQTRSSTLTNTRTISDTITGTPSPSSTLTETFTHSNTPTSVRTRSATRTNTATTSSTLANIPTHSRTFTDTTTLSRTLTETKLSSTASIRLSASSTPTISLTNTESLSTSLIQSNSVQSATTSLKATQSLSLPSATPSLSVLESPTLTKSLFDTESLSDTVTDSSSLTASLRDTLTQTPLGTTNSFPPTESISNTEPLSQSDSVSLSPFHRSTTPSKSQLHSPSSSKSSSPTNLLSKTLSSATDSPSLPSPTVTGTGSFTDTDFPASLTETLTPTKTHLLTNTLTSSSESISEAAPSTDTVTNSLSTTVSPRDTSTFTLGDSLTKTVTSTTSPSNDTLTSTQSDKTATLLPVTESPTLYLIAKVGRFFSYFIPLGFFPDPDRRKIFFSATLLGNRPLPTWLSLSSFDGGFGGTPPEMNKTNLTLVVSAFYANLATSRQQLFNVYIDHLPQLNNVIPNQLAGIHLPYNLTPTTTTFSDADGDRLTYHLQLENGESLPAWLHFNATTTTLWGTPDTQDMGTHTLRITANDPYPGSEISTSFALVVENFPVVAHPIPNQLTGVGGPFYYTLPRNTFFDADDDALTYRASLLPAWLTWDAYRLQLKGTPQLSDGGVASIGLIASDRYGASASCFFTITVENFPTLSNPLQSPIRARQMRFFRFPIPANTFTNLDGYPLVYTVNVTDGPGLPSWLSFNPSDGVLSGIPPLDSADLPLLLIASRDDDARVQSSTPFVLQSVPNYPPLVGSTIVCPAAPVTESFVCPVPPDAFINQNLEGILTYAAEGLPPWLNFDNATNTFIGTPGRGDVGFYKSTISFVTLLAIDPPLSTSTTVKITVTGISYGQLVIAILAPILSTITALLMLWRHRELFLNRINQRKYRRSEPVTLIIGEKVKPIPLTTPMKKIATVEMVTEINLPWSLFWKKNCLPVPGGARLPHWLEYDKTGSFLYGKTETLKTEAGSFTLVVKDRARIIQEEFKLVVVESEDGAPHTVGLEKLVNRNEEDPEVVVPTVLPSLPEPVQKQNYGVASSSGLSTSAHPASIQLKQLAMNECSVAEMKPETTSKQNVFSLSPRSSARIIPEETLMLAGQGPLNENSPYLNPLSLIEPKHRVEGSSENPLISASFDCAPTSSPVFLKGGHVYIVRETTPRLYQSSEKWSPSLWSAGQRANKKEGTHELDLQEPVITCPQAGGLTGC